MYDKNAPFAARRSGDELLRRNRCGCGGNVGLGGFCGNGKAAGDALPVQNRPASPPHTPEVTCPGMPSLAMVYAPKQGFCELLSPKEALCEGSLFRELIKPFCGRSVRSGRC